MDAAIAACAVQCVVESASTGLGGDCFALYSRGGTGEIIGFNGSGRSPAAATADYYAERGISAIDRQTPHAVTVPGAVDAWATLAREHGTRELGELLELAIRYARDGYAVAPRSTVTGSNFVAIANLGEAVAADAEFCRGMHHRSLPNFLVELFAGETHMARAILISHFNLQCCFSERGSKLAPAL